MKNQNTLVSRGTIVLAGALASTSAMAGLVGDFVFIGVDDSTVSSYLVDPNNMASMTPVSLGVEVWGAAGDDASQTLYISEGSTLSRWNYNGFGEIGSGTLITGATSGATLVMEGLGFMNGVLYGSRVGNTVADPEGIYSIDPVTAQATLVHAYPTTTGQANSGFDAGNGLFYATDDGTATRSLASYDPNNGFVREHVASYPAGETDIDGLAIGGGAAWLLEDDASATGNLYRWDFGTQTYSMQATPWATSEVFSGAAYISIVPEPGTFVALGIGLAGLIALRRRS